MNTADVLLYSSIACAFVAVVSVLVGLLGEYRPRLMYALTASGLAGFAILLTLTFDTIEDDFAVVVSAVEAKYDVEVTESSRGGGPKDLRTWTIDGTDRECYLDGLPSATDFRGYTDPVLRCAPATPEVVVAELDSDD